MENRVHDVGVLKMEEEQRGTEDRVLRETVEKRDGDVSSELKVVPEGEEVFEEAVDTHSSFLQEEDAECGLDREVDAVEGLREAAVEGISNKENEVEEFEEAIGIPGEAEKHGDEVEEVQVEEKIGGLNREENADKVLADIVADDGGTDKEVISSVNKLLVNGENSAKEIVGGGENLHEGKEPAGQIDSGVDTSVNRNATEVVVDGNRDLHNAGESGDQLDVRVNISTEGDVPKEVVDGGGDLCYVGELGEKTGIGNSMEETVEPRAEDDRDGDVIKEERPTVHQDCISGTHEDGQSDASKVNGWSNESQVEESRELNVAPDSNHVEDVDVEKIELDKETASSTNGDLQIASSSTVSASQDAVGEKISETTGGVGYQDDTVKDVSVGQDGNGGNVSQENVALPFTYKAVLEKAIMAENQSLVPSNESKMEKNERMLEDNTVSRVAESSSSQVVGENQERSAEAGKQERKNSKDGNTSKKANGENEIQPAPEPTSSSGKSSTQAPLPARPAGLGRAAALLEPASRAPVQPRVNGAVSPSPSQQIEESSNGEMEDHDETREKLQMIRVKFLRLARRLGQTPHNVVVAQVLYRLGLAEQLRGRNGGRVGAFSFDRASAMAEQLEASGQAPLDFSCTIMVLGKTGVGKSATINSIFDEVKFGTDAFDVGTKKVQDVVGTVQGIKVRVIDTPGLLPSWTDQRHNEKILHSVKRFIKKTPPDIVLYLDRMDVQSRDLGDMPLLRTITDIFGPSIWFNAIVVLTHAASAPPDGPNGIASSYDMFVTQRSHVVQQAIRQAAGDMRLMNPVSLVENHSACRTNRAGQRVLPNGQVWKPHLLLLSFASKILAEANALLKLQDSPPGKPFATRSRAPPLPFLLSSLLQPRAQVKLPEEQFGDEDSADDDIEESSDSDDEPDYDELPPFKRLTKAQLSNLTKAQKKAYFDELEYREKLFMKKQLKEEKRRRQMMKKMAAEQKDQPNEYGDNVEEESGGAASVPVPMPDLALPASFDSDNPTHRYRYLDTSSQWLVRPVLDTQGWDHDVGYEGINVERLLVVKDKVPISFSGQVTKDKKDANIQMEVASSIKHGEGKATSLGLDMQTVGKDLAYTLRGETRFCNYRKNKATAGLSMTLLNDALSAGFKVEDKLIANKRFRLVMTGGAMTSRGDIAYGGSLDATIRDKEYPLGRSLFTLGLSVMDWHGDLAVGGNVQSQLPIGRSTNLITRANLNNRGAGQVSVRVNSSEQLQIALVALIPLFKKLLTYPQQLQFGQ